MAQALAEVLLKIDQRAQAGNDQAASELILAELGKQGKKIPI